jgi:DNA-binding PadR family transcriptional regulator
MDRELLLLGLLRRHDMHGYQLHEFINQSMSSCIDLKKSTAYFLLDKMAASGWISETEVQDGNRPPRRVYQLTDAGEATYQRLLRENLSSYHAPRFPDDIGLAFLDSLPATEARELLQKRRDDVARELAQAQATPSHPGTAQWVIDHLISHLQAELTWLDEVNHRISITMDEPLGERSVS